MIRRMLIPLLASLQSAYCPADPIHGSVTAAPAHADTLGRTGHGGEPPDSVAKEYVIQEVVITATRSAAPALAVPSAVSVIGASSLAIRPGGSLGDVLQGHPGALVRSYGGPGALHTLSLRGMSPEHTLVLVDGQKVTNPQNGQIDLSLYPLYAVGRVEIARGGFSGLYGADAVGGVVDVQTRQPAADLEASVQAGFGSARFRQLGLRTGGRTADVVWLLAAQREYGRGDYPYEFSDGTSVTRQTRSGSDYALTAADGFLQWEPAPGVRTTASLFVRFADRGSPGPVTDLFTRGTARLADDVRRMTLRGEVPIGPSLRLAVAGSAMGTRQRYFDPAVLVGNTSLQSESRTESYHVSPSMIFLSSPRAGIEAGGEYSVSEVSGSELRSGVRRHAAIFATASWFVPLGGSVLHEAAVYPSLRYDRFTDAGSAFSPRIGVNLGILRSPTLRFRASAGRSFRVPSFNDMYWVAGGNPDLRPERAVAVDAGLIAVISAVGDVTVDAGVYGITARDRILWIPGPGGVWSPRNIGLVSSRGVEVDIRWALFGGRLRIGMNTLWAGATKQSEDYPGDATMGNQLIYVPPQSMSVEAEADLGRVSVYAGHRWTSFRYTTESNDRILPSYAVTSASVRWEFGSADVRLHLKGEVTNLFNVAYQVIALYPMPLREFRLFFGASL